MVDCFILMHMKKSIVRIIFIVSTFLVLIVAMNWTKYFLSYAHPLESQNYLFEGWLNAWEIEKGVEILSEMEAPQIIVIGRKYKPIKLEDIEKETIRKGKEGIVLWTNACIIIPPEFLPALLPGKNIKIAVEAKGGVAENISTHFSLAINGKRINSHFVGPQMRNFTDSIFLAEEIQSFSIYYDNDLATDKEGRYLIVKSIRIGQDKIILDEKNVVVSHEVSSNFTGYSSAAEEFKNYMDDLGMDPTFISTLEFSGDTRNKTLEAARAFKFWPGSQNIQSFNVISQKLHSRRSWITYKKILPENTNVGVLFFTPHWKGSTQKNKQIGQYFKRIDEMFAYMGNWIFLSIKSKD